MHFNLPSPETTTVEAPGEAGQTTQPGPVSARFSSRSPDLDSSGFSGVRSVQLLNFGSSTLLLALVLSVFAGAPLLYPGIIQTHAGFAPIWNVADLRSSLGHWEWLPHIAVTFDPFRSDGLLPYYLAALLPLSPLAAVKWVFGLAWLLGSAGMFLWLKNWLGRPGALLASLVYTYLPYRLVVVYVRGAWGEALFWALLPWALWTAVRFVPWPSPLLAPHTRFRSLAQSPPGFIAVAGLWLLLASSHLGLTVWALLFVLMFWLVLSPRQAILPGLAALSGTAVTAVLLTRLTKPLTPVISPADHLLYFPQLFSAGWGLGFSRPGWSDDLSLQLGLAAIGLSILSVTLWPRRQAPGRLDRRLLFFLAAAIFLTLVQLTLVDFVWRLPFGPASTLAYPWQLLGLAGLCLAVLAGTVLWLDEQLVQPALLGAVIVFVMLSSYNYLEPQFIPAGEINTSGFQAVVGDNRLALLDHEFAVSANANAAGLEQGTADIPLAVYGPPQADDILVLELTWQPLQPFNQDFKVFVHLVDPQNEVLAQFDGQPRAGEYPTSGWIPGELIVDRYTLTLPSDLPPGPYRVFVGLYDEASMARLPVPGDAEGRIILDVR